MNAPASSETTPILGTAMAGGFYGGRIRIDGQMFALIVAPKAEGQIDATIWIPNYKAVPGALSYHDGLTNTNAMAEAGSELAQRIRALRIGEFDDWYLPSLDELEVLYRNLKPGTQPNDCYARSGINLNAAEPTPPYTPGFPVQTQAELFKAGGAEAFDDRFYWSSTQHASHSDFAWGQHFGGGNQSYRYGWLTGSQLRARAVRRLPI